MNVPYVSLTLTRRYVTELVRSPRASAALAPRAGHPSAGAPKVTVARAARGTAAAIGGIAVPMIPQTSQRAV